MDSNSKPKYLVPADEERGRDYNLGLMDGMLWAKQELQDLIVHTELKPADVREIIMLMDAMIRDCQYQRLKVFENSVVPIRVEFERIKDLVDGCEFEEVHIKK